MANRSKNEVARQPLSDFDVEFKASLIANELRKKCKYLWGGGIDPASMREVLEQFFRDRAFLG